MRLDKYLKVSRIIKRRTIAKEACSQGRVTVNKKVAKASDNISVDDIISVQFGHSIRLYKVLDIKEHVSKEEANGLYE
ncbi:MAG: RNA-binding S4 domain-containing protein, partial [Clostridiales bacterium]|nr:RNA-binding S4 domain-containing protein [Clostridiales bacterium]